jgi:hypothetical protein
VLSHEAGGGQVQDESLGYLRIKGPFVIMLSST